METAAKQEKKNQRFSKKKIKAFLKTDRTILMICISIAFIFWLITKLSYSYKDTISVRLNYKMSAKKVFTYPPAKELLVYIEGKGWDLLGHSFSSAKREINIQVAENEIRTISASSLNSKLRQILPDASILSISPENLLIQTEDIAIKTIPVVLDQQIQLAPLHQFADSIVISPRTIEIRGPASIIRNIHEWKTNVYMPEKKISKDIDVELTLRTHSNSNIICSTNQIRYKAAIEEITEKQIIVPVKIINAPDSLLLVILPKKVKVSCRVGLSDYQSLNSKDFSAIVDFKGIELKGQNSVRIIIDKQPEFVRQVTFLPKKATFIIHSRQSY
jgi:YbbR domain-containing protein